MHVDLIDLRLYLNVVRAGNITAGASVSHLSLAAASARIRAMEAALGVEFLQRSRRGVSPTPAGQALAQHARLLLQQMVSKDTQQFHLRLARAGLLDENEVRNVAVQPILLGEHLLQILAGRDPVRRTDRLHADREETRRAVVGAP